MKGGGSSFLRLSDPRRCHGLVVSTLDLARRYQSLLIAGCARPSRPSRSDRPRFFSLPFLLKTDPCETVLLYQLTFFASALIPHSFGRPFLRGVVLPDPRPLLCPRKRNFHATRAYQRRESMLLPLDYTGRPDPRRGVLGGRDRLYVFSRSMEFDGMPRWDVWLSSVGMPFSSCR